MDTSMKERSLVSQHIVYNKITSDNISISSFVITPELWKCCMQASQWYKEELKKAKEDKVRSEQSLKCKAKHEELENIKRRKAGLQTTINALVDSIEQETRSTDKNQDLSAISKAAVWLRSVKEKEKTLKGLEAAQDNIKKRFESILTYLLLFNSFDFCLNFYSSICSYYEF